MFRIISEHGDFLLINKDPQISFHQEPDFPGLPTLVRQKTGLDQLYPVHRLDKMTSGLLLFAKNKDAARELAGQFAAGSVEKRYLAISDRRPKKKQGLIKGDMARSRRGAWKILRSKNRPAKTSFISTSLGDGLRLYLLKPYTGKTHQLRVALKSIGAPAIGDPTYHPNDYAGEPPDRGYLHSFFLAFKLAGTNYHFTCEPDIGKLFNQKSLTTAYELLKQDSAVPTSNE